MIMKALPCKETGQGFAITGICGLAGAVALPVGLPVRKTSEKRVLGLTPETAAVGHPAVRHPGSERAPYRLTRPHRGPQNNICTNQVQLKRTVHAWT